MKILRGRLVETRYTRPTVELNSEKECPLRRIKETTYETNEVTYMSDKLGLHKISNPDPIEFAVSLHCESIRYNPLGSADQDQCTLPQTLLYTAAIRLTRRPA
jgi:hypothetical protein